eukprot:COSAG02_NODE_1129_length_14415_cov_828.291911_13_plen_130_part_00
MPESFQRDIYVKCVVVHTDFMKYSRYAMRPVLQNHGRVPVLVLTTVEVGKINRRRLVTTLIDSPSSKKKSGRHSIPSQSPGLNFSFYFSRDHARILSQFGELYGRINSFFYIYGEFSQNLQIRTLSALD